MVYIFSGNLDQRSVFGWNTADAVVGRQLYGEDYEGPVAPVVEFGTTQIPLRSMVEISQVTAEISASYSEHPIDVAAQMAQEAPAA